MAREDQWRELKDTGENGGETRGMEVYDMEAVCLYRGLYAGIYFLLSQGMQVT